MCCCLGQINKFNQVEILDSAVAECDGFIKGKYESVDSIARAIRFAISDIEKEYDFIVQSAYINILGKYVEVFSTKYSVELDDKYAGVTQANIDSIIEGVAQVQLPDDYQIIDIIPTRFITDTKVTDDPIGIFTKTLSADVDLVIAPISIVKKISDIMQKAGLAIDGIVANGYAIGDLVLEEEEVKNGVLLLDVGSDNVDISVFKGNCLLYTDSLPIGGNTITNDISIVLNISYEEAEKLKKQYGLSETSYIDHDYNIKLTTFDGTDRSKAQVKCSELVEIMAARVDEIFSIIKDSLINNHLMDEIKTTVIFGQGFNGINKVEKTAERIIGNMVRFGNAKTANLLKPESITSYGVVKHISNIKHTKNIGSKIKIDDDQSLLDSTVKSIRKAFGSAINKFKK